MFFCFLSKKIFSEQEKILHARKCFPCWTLEQEEHIVCAGLLPMLRILYIYAKLISTPIEDILCNTPGSAGGPGGRDRTLAVKSRKKGRKSVFFFVKKLNELIFFFCIYRW